MNNSTSQKTQRLGLIGRIRMLLQCLRQGAKKPASGLQFSMLGCSLPEYERLWRGTQTNLAQSKTKPAARSLRHRSYRKKEHRYRSRVAAKR